MVDWITETVDSHAEGQRVTGPWLLSSLSSLFKVSHDHLTILLRLCASLIVSKRSWHRYLVILELSWVVTCVAISYWATSNSVPFYQLPVETTAMVGEEGTHSSQLHCVATLLAARTRRFVGRIEFSLSSKKRLLGGQLIFQRNRTSQFFSAWVVRPPTLCGNFCSCRQ